MSAVRPPRLQTAEPELDPSAFADRVMGSIEATPQPSPARSFGRALRSGSSDDALASLAVAWHLATVRSWSVAPRVRARSMALVLAVASVLATGSLVAAAAVRVAVPTGPDDHHVPAPAVPAGGIADPEVDPGAPGADRGIPADLDHLMTAPDVEPQPTARPTASPRAPGAGSGGAGSGTGTHHDSTGDGGGSSGGSGTGSGTHEAGDSDGSGDTTDATTGGGSTDGSHDGDTGDPSPAPSGGDDRDGGSSDTTGSHDGNGSD